MDYDCGGFGFSVLNACSRVAVGCARAVKWIAAGGREDFVLFVRSLRSVLSE